MAQGRSKRDRRQRLRQRAATDTALLDALTLLRARRAPYDQLLAELVTAAMEEFAPLPNGPLIELGAGTGQLRRWLPQSARERMLHTDPSDRALLTLRNDDPTARTAVASAQHLPVDAGGGAGALGLCVFDAIQLAGGTEETVRELGRVLAPGAPFLHILDMSTLVEGPLQQLHQEGMIPIPNVVGDPGDHPWPLDMVLFERDWLGGMLELMASLGHPLVTTFGLYFQAFLGNTFGGDSFVVNEAADLFRTVAASADLRAALATHLTGACQVALQRGYPARSARPFHSGRYLAQLLESSFGRAPEFRILHSGLRARWSWGRHADPGAPRYRSLCLGHERRAEELPRRLLSEEARRGPLLVTGTSRPDEQQLVEVGVHLFVAQRT